MPTQISRTRGDFHFFMIVLPFEVAEVVTVGIGLDRLMVMLQTTWNRYNRCSVRITHISIIL